MTQNLFMNTIYIALSVAIILVIIPLIGVIATAFDMIVIKRKTKRINAQLMLIELKAGEILNDFSNCKMFSGMKKFEELSGLDEELRNIVEEVKEKKTSK